MNSEEILANKNEFINRYQLSKLHTFESAARHLSFALAAEELCISPSAVSHQINKLEEELNFKLFERFHRRITLTHDGKNLLTVVKKSLNILNQEILDIKNKDVAGGLTIYSCPSFIQEFLIPKLSQFTDYYPYITLNIISGNKAINFSQYPIDLAIYYDSLHYDELACEHLISETILPVCTPSYAHQYNLYNNPENLKNCVLLHHNHNKLLDFGFDEWQSWANHFSLSIDFNKIQNMLFDRSDHSVTAAINNAGIAIGRKQIIAKYLDSGQLVAPFADLEAPCTQRYYICKSLEKYNPKADIFIQWLKSYVQ